MDELLIDKLRYPFEKKLDELMLDSCLLEDLARVYLPLAKIIVVGINTDDRTQVIGINGAQGSGKTTFSTLLQLVLEEGFGLRVVAISIDDIYLSRQERDKLAHTVHPLFATRGVPGTHDVNLGIRVIDSLISASPTQKTPIPRFDKSTDNPFPTSQWDVFVGRPDVILFDGWIVGAEEQPIADLVAPVNDLEKEKDAAAVWRTYVNIQLGTVYKELFSKLDLLVMLQVPSFEKSREWRLLQEKKLRIKSEGRKNLRIMSDEEVDEFVKYYERLTRWMLKSLPQKVDMLFKVNESHRIYL